MFRLYKLITDENWNVIFKISKDLAGKLKDDNTVEVLFKDDGNTIWAYYDILTIDKEPYLNLKLLYLDDPVCKPAVY